MPVKHIKKAVAQVTQGQDMRLVGIAIAVIAVIAVALWLSQGAYAPAAAATPTPFVAATPTPVVAVATPTPVATPSPTVFVPVAGGQVTEKPHCTDGTPEGECNSVSGAYCRQAPLGLVSDCTKCPCPSGLRCDVENKVCKS